MGNQKTTMRVLVAACLVFQCFYSCDSAPAAIEFTAADQVVPETTLKESTLLTVQSHTSTCEIQEIGTCDNEGSMCASFRLHSDDAERLTGDGEDSLGPNAIEDSQYYSYAVISEADDGDIRSAVYPVAWRWEETHGDLEVWLDTKDRMGNIVQFSDPDENPNSPVKEGSTVTFYTILSAANSDCQELADAAETYGECTSYTDLSSESDTTESSESDTTESSEPDPWEQVSTKRKCSDLSNINNIASDDECKNLANDAGSIFYAYREDTNKCMHGNSCTEKSTNGNWILYRN